MPSRTSCQGRCASAASSLLSLPLGVPNRYEWEVLARLGSPEWLRNGPSRPWAVEALVQGKLPGEVSRILRRASWEAAAAADWPRVVALGIWLDYYGRAWENEAQIVSNVLQVQFLLGEEPFLRSRLQQSLPEVESNHLVALAGTEYSAGGTANLERVAQELRRRFSEAIEDERRSSSAFSLLRHSAQVWPLRGEEATSRFVRFCLERVSADASKAELVGEVAKTSRALGVIGSIRVVLKLLSEGAWSGIFDTALEHASLYALESGKDLASYLPQQHSLASSVFGVHEILRGRKTTLPDPPVALFKLRHVYEERGAVATCYRQAFWFFTGNHLLKRPEANGRWLSKFDPWHWPSKFLAILEAVAREFSVHLVAKLRFPVAQFYSRLKELTKPQWVAGDSSTYYYAEAAQTAVNELSLDITAVAPACGQTPTITAADLKAANESDWWPSLLWTAALLRRNRSWLNSQALDFLAEHEQQGLSRLGESFETRAEVCSGLALLMARDGRKSSAREWSLRCAENLIAHGYHKDMPLNEALDVVRTVIPVSERSPGGVAEEPLQWLRTITPAIVHVCEYTDGDEVHHLPVELAEALAEAEPSLHGLLRYRDWLIGEERYTEAEKVLVIFASRADLSVPLNLALAETAISPGARKAIGERAARGDNLARRIAEGISAVYGKLPTESDEDTTPAGDFFRFRAA